MNEPGSIGWHDLTVEDADGVAGVCHARGANADLPPQWIMYIVVTDLDTSLAECEARGGSRVSDVREQGASRFCVIRDPAGATVALYQA